MKASYEVSLLVAENMKAHTIAESLYFASSKAPVRNVTGGEETAKLDSVSHSNNPVIRRIQEMTGNTVEQVAAGVKISKFGFAVQLSPSIANCS